MSGIRYLISGKVLEDGTFIPNKRSKAGRPAADKVKDRVKSRWKMIRNRADSGTNYQDVTIHEAWSTYEPFQEWFLAQPYGQLDYAVDKDLLNPAARQYGPDTCVLLPKDVNSYITDEQGVPYARGGLLPGGYYVEAVGQDQNVLRMSRFNPIDKTWSLIELGPFASYNHAIAAGKEEKCAGVEVLIRAFGLCDKAKQSLRSRYL